ncbi:MAG: hypothetical protein Kow0092_38790 [Deferrisomatales bacterium]
MRTGAWVAVVALAGGLGCTGPPAGTLGERAGEAVAVEVNSKAPAFAARTLEGGTVRLADLVGDHVVLLEFWSVFCRSCLEEMEEVEALQERYRDEGLAVVSVNTDVFSADKVRGALRKAGVSTPYPVVRDPRQEVARAYRVELLPVTVVIDRQGWIRLYQEGWAPGDERRFERAIRRLLGRSAEEEVTLGASEGMTAFAPPTGGLIGVGERARGLGGRTLGGEVVALEDGIPRLLFFWSLYCNPCRGEYPEVVRLARRYGTRGLAAYAVNVDSSRLAERVGRFAREFPLLPCLTDDGALSERLGVRATPTVVLLDSGGTVQHAEEGSTDWTLLEARVRRALEGK